MNSGASFISTMPEYTPTKKLHIEFNSGLKGTQRGQCKTQIYTSVISQLSSTPGPSISASAGHSETALLEYDVHVMEIQPEDAYQETSSTSVSN